MKLHQEINLDVNESNESISLSNDEIGLNILISKNPVGGYFNRNKEYNDINIEINNESRLVRNVTINFENELYTEPTDTKILTIKLL